MFALIAAALITTASAAEGDFNVSLPDAAHPPLLSFVLQEDDTEAVAAGMTVYVNDGETTRAHDLACFLPDGVASSRLICQNGDRLDYIDAVIGELEVHTDEEVVLYNIIEMEMTKLQRVINRMGGEVEEVEEQDMGPFSAEAVWVGVGGWECQLEDKDLEACALVCGGVAHVESMSTSASGPTSSYFSEPGCDVSCKCTDGSQGSWNDAPETLTALP